MRDRLIELLKGAETKVTEMLSTPLALEEWLGIYADHLLANGVIVPPCKAGDIVYFVGAFTGQIIESVVSGISYNESGVYLLCENFITVSVAEQIGKTVFLTKEEAEAKLKEGVSNGNA